jgi:hypothetical protein
MTEHGEVLRGVTGTGAHLVIAKDDIHAPVEAVLHPPVLADCVIQVHGICRQTGNVEAMLERRLALDGALRGNDGKRLQVRPALWRMQAVDLVEGIAAAHLQPTVILLTTSSN